jgi:phosphohistidine phosphatase
MQLLIVRHGIAVDRGAPGQADEDRALTEEGQKKFREVAQGLAEILPAPDVLLTSPLVRARETAEIAAKAWGGLALEEESALAGGSPAKILGALKPHREKSLVAIFGHEPDVSELVAHLIGTKNAESVAFKKGGSALLELDASLARGHLLWFAPPKLLRAID